MNVSLSLKELATKQYTLTAKERLMVIVAIGMIVLSITIYINTSEVAAVEPVLPKSTVVTNNSQSALPMGKQVAQTNSIDQPLRNPFAKPLEVKDQKNPTDINIPVLHNNVPSAIPGIVPNMLPQNTPVSSIPKRDFKLTGIVSGENRQLAVIMSGSKSKAYGINDVVGAYQIKAINTDDIVLVNNDDQVDQVILRLESVSQKEGKTSDK